MFRKILFSVCLVFISLTVFSQVAINSTGANPDASAGLDVSFTNKGVLIPRIALTSATDNTTISSPATSLLVYNTGTGGLSPAGYYYWNGSQWVQFGLANHTHATLSQGAGIATFSYNGSAPATVGVVFGTTSGTVAEGNHTHSGMVTGTGTTNYNAYWTSSNTLGAEQYVAISRGGTGLGTTPTNGQLLIGNGTGYSLNTLTAGSGVTITNGAGTITISATGTGGTVTSISAGTPGTNTAGSGLTFSSNPITSTGSIALSNTGVTAGTYGNSGANVPNITVDAQGRLTAASNRTLTAGDIGAISGSCGTVNMLPKMASSTSITCSQIFDNGTNVGIGTTSPSYKLDVTGVIRSNNEIISTLGGSGQFRAIAGNYGAFIRNDGNDTYIPLLTASGDQYGSWNTLRPLRVNNATGDVFLANNAIAAIHSTGYLGIGTTSPSQRLHVAGNIQFTGALMPNGNAGSSGQLLVSQGSATPPAWQSISSLPFYGNNMSSVKLTTYATNNNTSAWTDLLTLNVTPVHNTIYIFASLGTRLEDNSGNAQFGQASVKARILVNSVEVARTASVITDFDYDGGNWVITSGSVSFSGIPVSVTPGVNTTIKLQWQPSILWATSPWRLGIDPNSTTVGDHAVLTVFD